MTVLSVLSVFIVLALAYSIMTLIRLHFISELTRRLLREESDWIWEHMKEFEDGRRKGPIFQRYHRLPPFAIMLHKFWRWPASFEREIGSVEQYYPLKK